MSLANKLIKINSLIGLTINALMLYNKPKLIKKNVDDQYHHR
jgi:hypothetical protein